jgi:hypothetical protein
MYSYKLTINDPRSEYKTQEIALSSHAWIYIANVPSAITPECLAPNVGLWRIPLFGLGPKVLKDQGELPTPVETPEAPEGHFYSFLYDLTFTGVKSGRIMLSSASTINLEGEKNLDAHVQLQFQKVILQEKCTLESLSREESIAEEVK